MKEIKGGFSKIKEKLTQIDPEKVDFLLYVDFSRSNLYKQHRTRLHQVGSENPYLICLYTITQAIFDIFPGHRIDVFRFGCSESQHLRVIPLDSNLSQFYYQDSVQYAYYHALESTYLSGPTQFSVCFQHTLEQAIQNPGRFVVAFILTNGMSQSVRLDCNYLFKAQYYPVLYNVISLGICYKSPLGSKKVRRVFPQLYFINYNVLRRLCLYNTTWLRYQLVTRLFEFIPRQFARCVESNQLSQAREVEVIDHKIVVRLYDIEILTEDLVFDGLLGDRDVM